MSYRDDLNMLRKAQNKRKKIISLIIKITVVALAAAFLVTAVLLMIDLASGNSGASGEGSGGGSGKDREKPVITLKKGDAIYMYVGENVALKSAVNVTDNSGSYTLQVDNSALDMDKEGKYSIVYIATDGSGNETRLTVDVVVTKKEFSYGTLMGLIENKAEQQGITKSMSKTEQVKLIYKFVNNESNIDYNHSVSNTPDTDAVRENWETYWVEEAIRTLGKGSGDCYSYYSVSKAFFEYFGIENVGIQRDNTNIPKREGTHFWSMVNVGTTTDEWYYYDATILAGRFETDGTRNGCLMTLEKIQSYEPNSDLGYDFYEFDPSKYPTASKKNIS